MNKKTISVVTILLFITTMLLGIEPDRNYRFYPEKLGLIYKDLDVITTDGLKIKTWFYPAQYSLSQAKREKVWNSPIKRTFKTLDKKKRPTIIICNGDAGNMSWQQYYMTMDYVINGYNVVTFDWRGFGESSEWEMNTDYLVYTEFLIDYESVIKEVVKQPEVDAGRIALIGWSTGAYLSMATASNNSAVKCFVGQALMTSFKDVFPLLQSLPKNKGKNLVIPSDYPENLNPIALAPKFNKSTFLIVGESDIRTPVWMSMKIMKELPGNKELWIVPNAEHGGPNGPTRNFSLYNKQVLQFLNNYL